MLREVVAELTLENRLLKKSVTGDGEGEDVMRLLMSRISWRISSGTFGLPTREPDFHRQIKRNPARCQRITASGLTITKAFRTSGAIR